MPHPLENKVEIKVQAKDVKEHTPKLVLQQAINQLLKKVDKLTDTYVKKSSEFKKSNTGTR